MSTSDQDLAKRALGTNVQEYELVNGGHPLKLSPPPDQGDIPLPNGCHLYWKNGEQGREYFSDEIGGGVQVWHTALVDDSTLLAAIVKEREFQTLEREIQRRKKEDGTK